MNIDRVLTIPRPPDECFELFTAGIHRWWPLHDYRYGGSKSVSIHLEAAIGGRFFERLDDGGELVVGTVVVCDPPHRIVFTWQGTDWEAATEVDVAFDEIGSGTIVRLQHRGFGELGDTGIAALEGFSGGWTEVLHAYERVAHGWSAEPGAPEA